MSKGFLRSDSPNAHLKIWWLRFINIFLKKPTPKPHLSLDLVGWKEKTSYHPNPNPPQIPKLNPSSQHLDKQKSTPTSVLLLAYWHLRQITSFLLLPF